MQHNNNPHRKKKNKCGRVPALPTSPKPPALKLLPALSTLAQHKIITTLSATACITSPLQNYANMKLTTLFAVLAATAMVASALEPAPRPASTWSQVMSQAGNERSVMLNSKRIDTTAHPSLRDVVAARDASAASKAGIRQYLVHVAAPLTDVQKAQVNAALAPAHLGQYMPHNTYLVAMDESAALAAQVLFVLLFFLYFI